MERPHRGTSDPRPTSRESVHLARDEKGGMGHCSRQCKEAGGRRPDEQTDEGAVDAALLCAERIHSEALLVLAISLQMPLAPASGPRGRRRLCKCTNSIVEGCCSARPVTARHSPRLSAMYGARRSGVISLRQAGAVQ